MKSGLLILSEIERNVLQVSLDHMKEHLEAIADEVDVTDRLEAVNNLQQSLKQSYENTRMAVEDSQRSTI